jgi:predicted SprT family Zn-dependent metalloprotease
MHPLTLKDVEILRDTKFNQLEHIQRLAEIGQRILDLCNENNLKGWTFKFSKSKRFLGRCYYFKKTIEITIWHVFGSRESQINDTIRHEIAHALVGPFVKSHGIEWKWAAAKLGAFPRACSYTQIDVEYKYEAKCPNCGKVFKRHRKLRKNKWSYHKQCGPQLGLLIFKR